MKLPEEITPLVEKFRGRVVKPGVIGRFQQDTAQRLAETIREAGYWCDVIPLNRTQFGVSVMCFTVEGGGDDEGSYCPA